MSKKVSMKLVGMDGNAFAILGRFQQAARRQGWSKGEIDDVMSKAMSGDYSNLLCVISANVDDSSENND